MFDPNPKSFFYLAAYPTYSSTTTITGLTVSEALGALTKPESDLDWLRRRVKEICWVLPKAA